MSDGDEASPIDTWCFRLQGKVSILSTWESMFYGCSDATVEQRPGPDGQAEYFLRSQRFDGLADLSEVFHLAADLFAKMSGAAKVFSSGASVSLGDAMQVHADGSRTAIKRVIANMRAGLEFLATISTGTKTGEPPEREAQRWLMLAEEDDNVADALEHFTRADNWFDLYKVYEVICRGVGGEAALDDKEWATTYRIEDVRRTANHYRHYRRRGEKPATPLNTDQARELLRQAMRAWLTEKLSERS
jgi:hypothetical protein